MEGFLESVEEWLEVLLKKKIQSNILRIMFEILIRCEFEEIPWLYSKEVSWKNSQIIEVIAVAIFKIITVGIVERIPGECLKLFQFAF